MDETERDKLILIIEDLRRIRAVIDGLDEQLAFAMDQIREVRETLNRLNST